MIHHMIMLADLADGLPWYAWILLGGISFAILGSVVIFLIYKRFSNL